MICPECGEETNTLRKWIGLETYGMLELVILVCRECNWVTIYDFNLIKQLNFENED